MVQNNLSVVSLALLLALSTVFELPSKALASGSGGSELPAFTLPDRVAAGTTVRIDGSTSMANINQALKQRFEREYADTEVSIASNGTAPALAALLNGDIDLAAIGRPLTEAETAQGLIAVPVARNKIAMMVGAENLFRGSLTSAQFAQIFRGEITNWSEVGGEDVPIRFIDRPETSDTRQALRNYPVFQSAPFAAGATAVTVPDDTTDAVIEELRADGISYAIADQVVEQPRVRVVPMHNTLPTNPRYPFSQPLVYVYKDTASPAAQSFLGFASAPVNQSVIAAARALDAEAIDAEADTSDASTSDASSVAAAAPVGSNGESETAASPSAAVSDLAANSTADASPADVATLPPDGATGAAVDSAAGSAPWLWWLLPLALLALLVWWLRGRRSSGDGTGGERETNRFDSVPATAIPSEPTAAEPAPEPIASAVVPDETAVVPDETAAGIDPRLVGGAVAAGAGAAAWAARSNGSPAADSTPDPWESSALADSEPNSPKLTSPESGSPEPDIATADANPPADTVAPPIAAPVGESSAVTPPIEEPSIAASVADVPAVAADLTDEAAIAAAAMAATALPIHSETTPPLEPAVENGSLPEQPVSEPGEPELPVSEQNLLEQPASEMVAEDIVASDEPAIGAVLPPTDVTSLPTFVEEVTIIEVTEDTTIVEDVVVSIEADFANSGAVPPVFSDEVQSVVEAAKFDVGQTDLTTESLAAVDQGLPDLPDGYGESRIVLMPRDPQWLYAYWDVPNEHKEALRRQGGQRLALRFYDVTDIDMNMQSPHSLQQTDCDELARDWYLPVPLSDRDYAAEIGYLTADGRWLMLARSAPVRVPPVYPSDWFEDYFVTLDWEDDLRGRTVLELVPPSMRAAMAASMTTGNPIYDQIFGLAQSAEALRVAGSLFGSMQMVPEQAVSSFVFPSGVGMWAGAAAVPAVPTLSGIGMSGVGMMMSGIGFSASMPPIRPRKFWLVADAELIVYGATEPDATVTIGGRPIKLNPDGTFRFQMSFQDGLIDYPILAVAADGEQTRSIHMSFTRETPERRTNTKDEATDEWLF